MKMVTCPGGGGWSHENGHLSRCGGGGRGGGLMKMVTCPGGGWGTDDAKREGRGGGILGKGIQQ